MQLIVGCRARGASWVGSETLVIPGKRLTIHTYVHANVTRLHVYSSIDFTSVYVYRAAQFAYILFSSINKIRAKISDVHLTKQYWIIYFIHLKNIWTCRCNKNIYIGERERECVSVLIDNYSICFLIFKT